MIDEVPFIFSDLHLSRRLERAEAQGNLEFVEARASVEPESGARWTEVAGCYAMFDGVESPLTQTFGLGLFEADVRRRPRAHRRVLPRARGAGLPRGQPARRPDDVHPAERARLPAVRVHERDVPFRSRDARRAARLGRQRAPRRPGRGTSFGRRRRRAGGASSRSVATSYSGCRASAREGRRSRFWPSWTASRSPRAR